jgi:hypothetical protein
MGPDDRQHTVWPLVVTGKARLGRLEQGVSGDTELRMGPRAAERPPQPRHRGQPGAIGGQGQPHHSSSRGANAGVNRLIRRGLGMIPRHRAGARGRRVDQGLPPCGDRLAARAAADPPDGVAGRRGDGAQPSALVRRPWGGTQDVLPSRTPQGASRGQPTEMAGVRSVPHLPRCPRVAGVCTRLVLTADAGSGRLLWGWGRRRPRAARGRARRLVASEPRRPVLSARASPQRGSGHPAPGSPQLRGRRRPAAKRSA